MANWNCNLWSKLEKCFRTLSPCFATGMKVVPVLSTSPFEVGTRFGCAGASVCVDVQGVADPGPRVHSGSLRDCRGAVGLRVDGRD